MIVLIHTSKSMRVPAAGGRAATVPQLLDRAEQLVARVRRLTARQLATVMGISPALAATTHEVFADWDTVAERQSTAVDSFIGDIYSGLQAAELSPADREYAQQRLRILSGLYGVLRPDDGIRPYRLEMGYRLPGAGSGTSLYDFWGDAVAGCLPERAPIVNLAAVEYSRTVTPYVAADRLFVPKFLTVDPKSGAPRFVTVHAKIARGAFARWLLTSRIEDPARLAEFAEIGYRYAPADSTERQPVFVCEEFGGKGLSVRLRG